MVGRVNRPDRAFAGLFLQAVSDQPWQPRDEEEGIGHLRRKAQVNQDRGNSTVHIHRQFALCPLCDCSSNLPQSQHSLI